MQLLVDQIKRPSRHTPIRNLWEYPFGERGGAGARIEVYNQPFCQEIRLLVFLCFAMYATEVKTQLVLRNGVYARILDRFRVGQGKLNCSEPNPTWDSGAVASWLVRS